MKNLLKGKELRAHLESKESSLDDYEQISKVEKNEKISQRSSVINDSQTLSQRQSEGSILDYIK